jgi:hypothetical protein
MFRFIRCFVVSCGFLAGLANGMGVFVVARLIFGSRRAVLRAARGIRPGAMD